MYDNSLINTKIAGKFLKYLYESVWRWDNQKRRGRSSYMCQFLIYKYTQNRIYFQNVVYGRSKKDSVRPWLHIYKKYTDLFTSSHHERDGIGRSLL